LVKAEKKRGPRGWEKKEFDGEEARRSLGRRQLSQPNNRIGLKGEDSISYTIGSNEGQEKADEKKQKKKKQFHLIAKPNRAS